MRRKDNQWTFNERACCWEEINAQLLMDIRDELKRLNSVLYCRNFLDIPHKLEAIRRNTTKRRKKAK